MFFYVHSADTTQHLIKPLLLLHSSNVVLWQQAGEQINGRGQRGRFWHSNSGNLYITGCIFGCDNIQPGQVSITGGVALAQMLENLNTNQEISLKWPNDLLINSRKCGGILIERYDNAYLVGIGININSHPENVETSATHLNLYGEFNLWDISLKVQRSIENAFRNFSDFSIIQNHWWNFAKRSVHKWIAREPLNGEVIGIDHLGQLLIQMPNGDLQAKHNRF